MSTIQTVTVTRYMQPLREGGSLPALAEADDGFKYVVKFRGGGHGVKTLIAELIGGEIARTLGLYVPEIVFAELDACFGRTEGDEEIQDLLKASKGLNLGLRFLTGAFMFDSAVNRLDPLQASSIVWLDSLITNADRSFRNTNMLVRNKELWLIDHGSCLYFHYNWNDWEKKSTGPFPYVKDHALLAQATQMDEADRMCRELLQEEDIARITGMIPDDWLVWDSQPETPDQIRAVYESFLIRRLRSSATFTKEIQDAANARI